MRSRVSGMVLVLLVEETASSYLDNDFIALHSRFDIPDQRRNVATYVCRVVRILPAGNRSIDVFVVALFDDWILRVGTKFSKVNDRLGLVPIRAVSHYRDQVALTRVILKDILEIAIHTADLPVVQVCGESLTDRRYAPATALSVF